jgi:hypothetical protein
MDKNLQMNRNDYSKTKVTSGKQFLFNIIKSVEQQIHRNLTNSEEDLIINCVKKLNVVTFINDADKYQSMFRHITTNIIEEFRLMQCENTSVIDTHEILKRHIGKTSETEYMPTFEHEGHTKEDEKRENITKPTSKVDIGAIFGLSNIRDVVGQMSNITTIKHAYFMLDTKYRTLENDGTRYFKWSHINSVTRGQGTINMLGTIRDIVAMKTYPIRIPNVASAYTPYERISVFVEEFISQSYIAHENRNFHFIGGSEIKGNWVNICPDDYNDGEYNFNKPITHIDTITISFASPLEPVIFDKDRLQTVITSYASPTILQTSENHNLTIGAIGDIIYIDDFNTVSVDHSETSDIINRQAGHTATVLTPTTFSIPVDTSAINTVLTGTVNPPGVVRVGVITPEFNSTTITGLGTLFLVDYIAGDYIHIFDSINSVLRIASITDNTSMTTDTPYNIGVAGSFIHGDTSSIITGVGSVFKNEIKTGDTISITDGATNPSFVVASVESDTSLTLITPYNGATGIGFAANKDNRNTLLTFSTFFGSKRIFMPIELTYIAPEN